MADDEELNVPFKRRKGVKQVRYKSEVIKEARVKGESYTNWKGNLVEGNRIGKDCECSMKCFKTVNEGNIKEINVRFYSFGSKNEQDAYLQSLITVQGVVRRRQVSNTNPKARSNNYTYRVSCSSGSYSVCKKAFNAIHGITDMRVRRLCKLLSIGKSPVDLRGKNRPGNAKPGSAIKQICDHIEKFPLKVAHYTNRDYKFLSEKLNVNIMHSMFKELYPDSDILYSYYYKIFKERYNYSFGRPQVDTCVTCEELGVKIKSGRLNDVAKRVAVAEKMVHVRQSKKFFSKMKEVTDFVKNLDDSAAICIDYMQNLELPKIPIQDIFYLRTLTVNVFCIHEMKTGDARIFLYHEGAAKKGANEVATFLYQYIEGLPHVKHLYLFSDGCGGQAKNNTIVRALLALVDTNRLVKIEQFFPIRGHSFMPCDRDFAVIKRKVKSVDRTYTIKEYVEQVITSSNNNKFSVIIPETEDIIDFKKWWKQYYKGVVLSTESFGRNVPKESKVKFNVSKFRHLLYESTGTVIARQHIDGLLAHTFKLGTGANVVLPKEKAHTTGKIPLKKKKMDDLKKVASSLPDDTEIQTFWQEIYEWPITEDAALDSDENDGI